MFRRKAVLVLALFLAAILLAAPARAGQALLTNPDGTVADPEAGLVWSALDNQGDIDWQDARRWARFTFPSTLSSPATGWRLPTAAELEGLVNASTYYAGYETACGLDVRIHSAIELSCGFVWTEEERGIQAWYYSFQNTYAVLDRKTKKHGMRALAVRPMTEAELAAAESR